MAFTKYLVPALAIAGLANAASCSGSKTIENQSDADKLSSCKTFKGDITIKEVTTTILLDGIQEIDGSLTAKNVTMKEFSAPKLKTIDDEFVLNTLTELTSLLFPSLEEVGSLNFEALPKLQNLGFTKGVSKANNIRITNTDLTSLAGIELESVQDMEITNNYHLTEVDVNEITKTTGLVSFSANHKDLKIKFPNLESAKNMSFRNATIVELPALKKSDGLLGFYSNYFKSFFAPNLTETGDIVFADNSAVTNISLPVLKTVDGAIQIANNTHLKEVNGLPKLTTVSGTLDFSGNFSKVAIPSIDEIGGGFNLQSTGKVGCDDFEKLKGDKIKGDFTCLEKVKKPSKSDETTGGSDSGSTSTSKAGAIPLSVEGSTGLLVGLLGAIQFIL